MTIALLTDFGTKDYFVGAMKGVILSINENAQIIDITHEIPSQDIQAASFMLRACYRDFPAKTIFVAVVDPGCGAGEALRRTADLWVCGVRCGRAVGPDGEPVALLQRRSAAARAR